MAMRRIEHVQRRKEKWNVMSKDMAAVFLDSLTESGPEIVKD